MNRFRPFAIVLWISWFVAVVVGSLLPGTVASAIAPLSSDTVPHALAYYVLTVMPGFIFPSWSQRLQITITIIAVSIVLEAVQLVVPGRNAEWVDVLWNLFGALLGWITTYMLTTRRSHP